jgi:hypothetical protein
MELQPSNKEDAMFTIWSLIREGRMGDDIPDEKVEDQDAEYIADEEFDLEEEEEEGWGSD